MSAAAKVPAAPPASLPAQKEPPKVVLAPPTSIGQPVVPPPPAPAAPLPVPPAPAPKPPVSALRDAEAIQRLLVLRGFNAADVSIKTDSPSRIIITVKGKDYDLTEIDKDEIKELSAAGLDLSPQVIDLLDKGSVVSGTADKKITPAEVKKYLETLDYFAKTRHLDDSNPEHALQMAAEIYGKTTSFTMEDKKVHEETVKGLSEGLFKEFKGLEADKRTVEAFLKLLPVAGLSAAIKEYIIFKYFNGDAAAFRSDKQLTDKEIEVLIDIVASLPHTSRLSPEVQKTYFGISSCPKYEGAEKTDEILKWLKGEKKAEEKPKEEGTPDEYNKLVEEAQKKSPAEALPLWEKALEKAPKEKVDIVRQQIINIYSEMLRYLPSESGVEGELGQFLVDLAGKSDYNIASKVVSFEQALQRLEQLKTSATYPQKSQIDALLAPPKWDDDNVGNRNTRGIIEHLKLPQGIVALKSESKFKKLLREHSEAYSMIMTIYAEKDEAARVRLLGETDKDKLRTNSERCLAFAKAMAELLRTTGLKSKQYEQFTSIAYTLAGIFNPANFEEGIKYYAGRVAEIKEPFNEQAIELLEAQANLIHQKAVSDYQNAEMLEKNRDKAVKVRGTKQKKRVMAEIKSNEKPLLEKIINYYQSEYDRLSREFAAAPAGEQPTLRPKLQALEKTLNEYRTRSKGLDGKGGTIKDLPLYSKVSSDVKAAMRGGGAPESGGTRRRGGGTSGGEGPAPTGGAEP